MTISMHNDLALFIKPEEMDGKSSEVLVVDICDNVSRSKPVYVRWDFVKNDWVVERPEVDEKGYIKMVDGKQVLREMK